MMRQPQATTIVPRTTANKPRLRPALPLKFAVKLLVWMRRLEEDDADERRTDGERQ